MSDSATKVQALLAVRANTRLVLATELVARNAECEALRAMKSVAPSVTPARAAYLSRQAAKDSVKAPTPFQIACAKAREMAMKSGTRVTVSV